jgi:hypothetical protein
MRDDRKFREILSWLDKVSINCPSCNSIGNSIEVATTCNNDEWPLKQKYLECHPEVAPGEVMTKIVDWMWYTIGMKFWSWSARRHPQEEVKRRLSWMTLDCKEKNAVGIPASRWPEEVSK